MPTPMQIIAACDAGPDAMVALGLARPATLLDVVRTMWAAQAELTAAEARALAVRDRMELDYTAAATKALSASGLRRRPLPFAVG